MTKAYDIENAPTSPSDERLGTSKRKIKFTDRAGTEHTLTLQQMELPYGMWTCEDGREVLFNRKYWPIWERREREPVKAADPHEWVKGIVKTEYFFNDGNPPWGNRASLRKCKEILQAFGDEMARARELNRKLKGNGPFPVMG